MLLIAEESAGVQTLRMLGDTGHNVAGVMASRTKPSGGLPTLWEIAQSLGCQAWPAELVKDPAFGLQMAGQQLDLILNVHSLYVIRPELLRAASIGAFNLHPGPLPRYAGLNAPSWAIYRGETTHGVTLHKMVPEVDAGPIAYQTLFPIGATDTAFKVASRCIREGTVLLRRLLETASHSPQEIPQVSQDLSKREYFGRGVPEDGILSWSRPAEHLVRFVRACDYDPYRSPWGKTRSFLNGREIAITRASLTRSGCGDALPGTVRQVQESIQVAASDEWVTVEEVAVQGRRAKPGEVLSSGDRLGSMPALAA